MATDKSKIGLVSSSKYDIYSKLLTIASKYTDINNEDFLKTGLFGYITESMALIARDSSFHKTMLYNESFLNTAVMPKSVYNWAKMFNINITAANPAYAEMMITIAVDDLVSSFSDYRGQTSKYGQDVRLAASMLVLDRGNQFIAGEFKFALEKSIMIYKNAADDDTFVVRYCTTESVTTQYQTLDSAFIKNTLTTTDGVQYLSFVVRAYQYEIQVIEKQIASSSFLNTKVHRFNFNNQFAGAKLFYKRGTIMEPIELRFSDIRRDASLADITSKFAYYNLIDTNTLQITFSSVLGDFIPAANSTLILELYSTRGASGNISFTGDVIFRLKEENIRNLPILVSFFNNISVSGLDSPSISKIKNTIINEISTRDVIVTETDLNNYFLILTALLETINDGKITFVKKRDDILRRVFSSYILMRDGLDINGNIASSDYTSNVIPTNTIDSEFFISDNISKPFGTIIKRKVGTLDDYEYVPANALDASDDDYYIIPFYTRITLSPFKKVKYIYNLTDDSTSLSYSNIANNSSNYFIVPSSVSVTRGIEGLNTSKFYNFKFNFTTNFNMELLSTSTNSIYKLLFFRRGNEVTPIETVEFTEGSNLLIESTENEEDSTIFNTSLTFSVQVKDDLEFDFSSATSSTDFGTLINLTHNNLSFSLPEDVKVVLRFDKILAENISIDFKSDGFLSLFRNLDEIMFSDILVNTKTVAEEELITSVTIKDIPVVHQSFFNSGENQSKFIKQLFVYIDMLKDNLGKLETNTFFDLKFYNTKGSSKYFNTTKIDIKLEMDVHVVGFNETLENQIKDYTRLLVDRSNVNNSLKVSVLIKELTAAFPNNISYIIFKGLNDTFNQYLEFSKGTGLSAPEYFSIPNNNLQFIKVIPVAEDTN
jgi:hypothetical protein